MVLTERGRVFHHSSHRARSVSVHAPKSTLVRGLLRPASIPDRAAPFECPPQCLASVHLMSMGAQNSGVGVPPPIQGLPPSLPGDSGDKSKGRISCCLSGQRDFCPSGERCNTAPVSRGSERWFLFQLLPCPQADWRVPPNSGFEAPEQVPQGASLSDADIEDFVSGHEARRLVHNSGPSQCLFSHSHQPRPQTVPQVFFSGEGLRIQCPPLRSVPVTTHFHQMHGWTLIPLRQKGIRVLTYLDQCVLHQRAWREFTQRLC